MFVNVERAGLNGATSFIFDGHFPSCVVPSDDFKFVHTRQQRYGGECRVSLKQAVIRTVIVTQPVNPFVCVQNHATHIRVE